MKIFLDDERETPPGWRRAMTVQEMHNYFTFEEPGAIEEISLDNDLGLNEQEGRFFLNWIEEKVFTSEFIPPVIHIHSSNPQASGYMVKTRESIQRELNSKGVEKDIIGVVAFGTQTNKIYKGEK